MPNIHSTQPTSPALFSTSPTAPAATTHPTGHANNPVDSFERVGSTANERPASEPRLSALQKHVMFFDRDGDGKIGLSESYEGFRALGFDSVRSGAFSFAINTALGVSTGAPWYAPLTVNVANIASAKHASDTDIYDDKGEFDPAKFEELFATYDTDGDDALSAAEFEVFYARNKEDSVGSLASTFEFGLLLEIAGDKRVIDGQVMDVVTRQTMERFYDGTLFFDIAGEPLPF